MQFIILDAHKSIYTASWWRGYAVGIPADLRPILTVVKDVNRQVSHDCGEVLAVAAIVQVFMLLGCGAASLVACISKQPSGLETSRKNEDLKTGVHILKNLGVSRNSRHQKVVMLEVPR